MIFIRSLFSLIGLGISLLVISTDQECPYVTTMEDRRANKDTLRIVQYNAEWLFIDYYANAKCPGDGCPWKNESMANTHLDYVRDVVQTLNPDIINLCEIECCDELNMLVYHLEDVSYKPYVKRGTDSSTGQNVGILTRIDPTIDLYRTETRVDYPIPGSKCGYTGSSGNTGVSKHYITEYDINGLQIAFIGAHLLAYPTDPSRCVQREAQAQVLQYVISDYIESGYEVIFMGDLNDYDGETLDINSHVPISQTLDILKGLKGVKKGQYQLTNVASFVDQNDRYTDWWDSDSNCNTQSVNDYSMIDHILVTQGILSRIKQVYMYHGYNEYCGKIDSDHYPIVMDIDTMYMEY